MFIKNNLLLDESGAGGGSAATPGSDANAQGAGDLNFETWVASQDEKVNGLLESHIKGLKSALESERESRKTFEKQIKDLAGKAEKGSEAEKQLNLLGEQITSMDRKASFYEEAHTAGVTNLKLAFVVASTDEMFDKKGNVNFVDLKAKYPELFGSKKAPKGNAGDGTDEAPVNAGDVMNQRIRRQSGRQ